MACVFEDERHDVRVCKVHGGRIGEDFYQEAVESGCYPQCHRAHQPERRVSFTVEIPVSVVIDALNEAQAIVDAEARRT